ncbi:MAG: phytanoyl-CoA dioxygenase family protein [Acidobacteria bacterium]|nr:phytanoyl-CoA dioxygenase family protein [Acidobacteriota bacterium]
MAQAATTQLERPDAGTRARSAPDRLTETRQPFDLSDAVTLEVERLDMAQNVHDMQEQGYTILRDVAPPEFTDRLRATCLRLAEETEGRAKGRSAALLLGRDPIFEDVVLRPKIQALVEIMCGKGALLSQLICSVRPLGAAKLPLHADQNWLPAPFPVHNQLLTLCWACDEFTEVGGCTKVIPGTHRLRRHPNEEEVATEPGAIPTECPAGSVVVWDGSIWHGNYPRAIPGERVVLHITFSRLALRPVEDYSHLDEGWLEDKPWPLRVMLGREDFLGSTTIARGHADYTHLVRTFNWAKT